MKPPYSTLLSLNLLTPNVHRRQSVVLHAVHCAFDILHLSNDSATIIDGMVAHA